MARQIILDTETTGLEPSKGHRMIEIGAVEMFNRRFTGKTLHYYFNPEREVDAGALAVHGLNNTFLSDKPKFGEKLTELLEFLQGAELIIHNASFDIGFIEHELRLANAEIKKVNAICTIIDTLSMARKMHPGQKNNLDALCKRYKISNAHRTLHGALLDAQILGQVYLAMTGGQSSLLEAEHHSPAESLASQQTTAVSTNIYEADFAIVSASSEDLSAHDTVLQLLNKKSNGKCIWLNND